MSKWIKVMAFNVRVEAKGDGINHFDYRAPGIRKMIMEESPDLIALPEASDHNRKWLRDNLPEYIILGCGRNENYRGETAAVAYKKDMFELVSLETFWLSNEPCVPGSNYGGDQSICPRLFVSASLSYLGGKPFKFIGIHTDHQGKNARILSSKQLLDYIEKQKEKVVLAGDFNAEPNDEEMRLLTDNPKIPLTDATCNIEGSFHGYKDIPPREMTKIDYILTNFNTDVNESYLVDDMHPQGIYLSDHRPVVSFVDVES